MKSSKSFYLVIASVQPSCGAEITYNLVISESLVDFIKRNKKRTGKDVFALRQWTEISESDWKKLISSNPVENILYVKLCENDLSLHYPEEGTYCVVGKIDGREFEIKLEESGFNSAEEVFSKAEEEYRFQEVSIYNSDGEVVASKKI